MLIEQDGPDWREKLPEIPAVPLSAQQHRKEEPRAELLQARAERAEQEKGERKHTHCEIILHNTIAKSVV